MILEGVCSPNGGSTAIRIFSRGQISQRTGRCRFHCYLLL